MSRRRRQLAAITLCAAAALCTLVSAASAGLVDAAINGQRIAERLPRVEFRGGPFIRRPRIVTITLAGDEAALVARVERFGNRITQTPWWRAVTAGYCAPGGGCIGEGRSGLAVRLDDVLPREVHAVEISALLRRHASAGRFGALDADSLLMVYLPRGVALRDADARYCGDGPRAFHRTLRFNDNTVAYAVMPRCGDEAALTGTASHELLEVVTNPDTSRPGFAFVRSSSTSGFIAAGIEAMDPCGLITTDTDIVDGEYVVRRGWSNRAAAAGHDPCVPARADHPFVALIPERQTVRLVNIGDSTMIGLTAAADRAVDSWSVKAIDVTGIQQRDRYVDLDLNCHQVSPREACRLRITLRKPTSHRVVVGVVSTLNMRSHLWPIEVLTR